MQMVAVDIVVVYDDAIGNDGGDDDGNHDDDADNEVKSLCRGSVLGEKGRHESAYQPGQGASNLKTYYYILLLYIIMIYYIIIIINPVKAPPT